MYIIVYFLLFTLPKNLHIMLRISSLIMILTSSFTLIAQDFVSSSSGQLIMEMKYNPKSKGVTLFSDFQNGALVDARGNTKEEVEVNYNRILGLFISRYQGKEIILNERLYTEVNIIPTETAFSEYNNMAFKNKINPEDPWRYYQVLYESEEIIFAKGYDSKVFSEGGINYGKGSDTDVIKTSEGYYILDNTGFEKIKLKTKDLTNKFRKLKNQIEKLEKQQGLNLKKEKDVIKLFSMLEEI